MRKYNTNDEPDKYPKGCGILLIILFFILFFTGLTREGYFAIIGGISLIFGIFIYISHYIKDK